MPRRPPAGHLGQSPLEIVAIPIVVGGVGGVGLLWGTGIGERATAAWTAVGSAHSSIWIPRLVGLVDEHR